MTDDLLNKAKDALTHAAAMRTQVRLAMVDVDSAIDEAITSLGQVPDSLPLRVVASPGTDVVANPVLQAAFDAALSGGIVYVSAGRYLVDTETMLRLRSGLILLLHPDAKLIGKPNAVKRSYLFSGRNISDFVVVGGQLFGDRLSHTYGPIDGKPSTHEWCMGIGLTDCQRGLVRDVCISQFAGDGLSIKGEDLSIVNVVSSHNRRQGMSIYSGRGIRVIGGEYAYTGAMGTNPGTPPMAGIDMEPDTGLLEDVLFAGVRSIGNGTSDLLAYCNAQVQGIRNVRVEGCTLVGAANGLETQSAGAGRIDVTARANTLGGHKGASFKVGAGSTVTIGDALAANANVITANVQRAPNLEFTLQGPDARTRYDIQVLTGGTAMVGYNRYRSPALA